MQCPKCGAFNPEGYAACSICGKSLREGTDETFFAPPSRGAGPQLKVRIAPAAGRSLEAVAGGQKLALYSILVNLVALCVATALGESSRPFLPFVGLPAIGLAILGLIRLGSGFGFSNARRVLLILAAFVPLLNLGVLVMMNTRATRELKAGGYKVGLLGAQART